MKSILMSILCAGLLFSCTQKAAEQTSQQGPVVAILKKVRHFIDFIGVWLQLWNHFSELCRKSFLVILWNSGRQYRSLPLVAN